MIDRRGFVTVLGAATLGTVSACRRAAEAPARQAGRRLGAQLYTVRGAMAADFAGTLERIRSIGYDEVEFAGYFGHSPGRVRDALAGAGLRAPAAHVELSALRDDPMRVLDDAATIGHEYLVVAWISPEHRRTADDWRRLAALLESAGDTARGRGMRVAYHNHDYEFVPVGAVVPFDLLLAETDRSKVAFELDVYWIMKAGYDPLEYLARHPSRFELLHLKDTTGPPDHGMVSVGAGIVKWDAVLTAAAASGARHMFVEHDEPPDPFETLRAGYEHLRGLERGAATRS